ncbi:hypothetical protein [Cohaesibacter intestini]|uniref:hypothetical protein n=1 Tax=Cohaesibacter intestini TaxID=2211145 RepID=UPI000DEA4029|nr:hypothetical protein [Cohaesibacter intestini]
MLNTRFLPVLSLLMIVGLSACQTVTEGVGSMFPSGTRVSGEVQWLFAASQGDVVYLSLQDGSRTLVAQELLPTPGAKHVPFDLVPANADARNCAQGLCAYSARLTRGEQVLASGQAAYQSSGKVRIVLTTAGETQQGDPESPSE